ncbi:MAG: polysaccharide biosynthesis/export family protein [Croceibacterium sp.]
MNVRLPVVCAILATAACGGQPQLALSPNTELVTAGALPAPEAPSAALLGPLDSITIEVIGLHESPREVVISNDGNISLPLAGTLHAQGLTTEQLSRAITEALRSHMRDPQVSVNLAEAVSRVVTVDGEVERPGLYAARPGMTLRQAVAQAGGETNLGSLKTVVVYREVGTGSYVGLYDLGGIRYGNYPDPVLFPDDRVVVGESAARQFREMLPGLTSLISTPLIILFRR